MHAVDGRAAAVAGGQLRRERVAADGHGVVQLRRILGGRVALRRVRRRLAIRVRHVGRLIGGRRDDVPLHVLPGAVEIAPVAGELAVGRLQPQPVAVRLGGGLVPVVGRLAHQRLDGVVRHALGAEVAVGGIVDVVPQRREPVRVDVAGLIHIAVERAVRDGLGVVGVAGCGSGGGGRRCWRRCLRRGRSAGPPPAGAPAPPTTAPPDRRRTRKWKRRPREIPRSPPWSDVARHPTFHLARATDR